MQMVHVDIFEQVDNMFYNMRNYSIEDDFGKDYWERYRN